MVIDWSINSGWEILTILSLIIGIALAIAKIYDIYRRVQKDKQENKEKELEKKRKRPKEAIIQFINIDAFVRLLNQQNVSLKFDVRNMGDYDTSVYIDKVILTVDIGLGYEATAKATKINKIELKKKSSVEGIILKFLILSPLAVLWDSGHVYFHYSYVLSSGKKVSKVSEPYEIRKREVH